MERSSRASEPCTDADDDRTHCGGAVRGTAALLAGCVPKGKSTAPRPWNVSWWLFHATRALLLCAMLLSCPPTLCCCLCAQQASSLPVRLVHELNAQHFCRLSGNLQRMPMHTTRENLTSDLFPPPRLVAGCCWLPFVVACPLSLSRKLTISRASPRPSPRPSSSLKPQAQSPKSESESVCISSSKSRNL